MLKLADTEQHHCHHCSGSWVCFPSPAAFRRSFPSWCLRAGAFDWPETPGHAFSVATRPGEQLLAVFNYHRREPSVQNFPDIERSFGMLDNQRNDEWTRKEQWKHVFYFIIPLSLIVIIVFILLFVLTVFCFMVITYKYNLILHCFSRLLFKDNMVEKHLK